MIERVLFLDIDGVLQSRRSIVAYGRGANPHRPYPLDEVAVRLMQRTVEETGAYVVISSSWRGGGPAQAAAWFASYGWYDAPIIGETPPRTNYREQCRGDVIQEWLKGREVGRYVIVDDSGDMLDGQPRVHVDGEEGYRWKDHERVVEILTQGPKSMAEKLLQADQNTRSTKEMAVGRKQKRELKRLHRQNRTQ